MADLQRKKMGLTILAFLIAILLPFQAVAAYIGFDYPGYSAKDILLQGGSLGDGVYLIDPDFPGGNDPFHVYANMWVAGGGWTLAHDAWNIRPDLDSHLDAINILSVHQSAEILFVGSGGTAYYLGHYYENTPIPASWTILSGSIGGLPANRPWSQINFDSYDVFVRETETLHYPAPVPIPSAVLLLGSGLIGLAGFRRKFHRN